MLVGFACPCCLFPPFIPQIYMVQRHPSSHSPSVNCAVVTEYNICVYSYIHTWQHRNIMHHTQFTPFLGFSFGLNRAQALLPARPTFWLLFVDSSVSSCMDCALGMVKTPDRWAESALLDRQKREVREEWKMLVHSRRQRHYWVTWLPFVWGETLEFLILNGSSWVEWTQS